MQVSTDQAVTTAPPPSAPIKLSEGDRAGLCWEVFMHSPSSFSFHIKDPRTGEDVAMVAGFPNRGKAELAAERECDERNVTPPDPDPIVIAGWQLQAASDRRGDWSVALCDAETGEVPEDVPEFKGYRQRDQAVAEASAWATANLRGGIEPPFEPTEPAMSEPLRVEPRVDAPAPPAGPTAEQLAAEADAAMAEVKAVEAAKAPPAAPEPMYDERVDEVWTLLDQRREVRERRNRVTSQLDLAKAQLKAINLELEDLDAKIDAAQQDAPRQRTLPLAPAPTRGAVDQAKVATAAQKIADGLKPGEIAWAFNGVDHVIKVHEHPPGYRAFLKGHEQKTEGLGPDYDQAVEACKNRAAIVFADAEPGTTEVRLPPRRGRKPKAAEEQPPLEESPDAPRVIAALRSSMNLDEAAAKLKVTTPTLQKWAAENGVTLSEHLSAETGQDEQPAPKASRRGGNRRGRKAK